MIKDIMVARGEAAMQGSADRGVVIVESGARVFNEHPKWKDDYGTLLNLLENGNEREQKLAATTAIVMENTFNYIEGLKRTYGESVVINSLGTLAPRMIDVVRIFFPNMIANLIAEIQPLDRQSGEVLTVKPIYSTTRSGVTQGQEVFLNRTDGTYASDYNTDVIGSGDGSTLTFTGTLSLLPTRPATAVVFVGTGNVAVDNGLGVLVGETVSTGTLNYASGAFSITFKAGSAPGAGVAITVTSRYDVEQSPDNIPEMEIGLNLVPIQAKPHPLRVRWSVAAQLAATAQYQLDVQDTVANLAGQFIKKERDYMLTAKISAVATHDSTLDFDCSISGLSVTKRQHFQDFMIKIAQADNLIFTANGRGNVSFIIGDTNSCAVISTLANFVPEPRTVPIGAYKIGSIDGVIDVIKDPSMTANRYIFGFRGMQTGDAAIILGEWIPLYFTPVFQNSNLQNSQGMMSMYDSIVNNNKYYYYGTLANYAA